MYDKHRIKDNKKQATPKKININLQTVINSKKAEIRPVFIHVFFKPLRYSFSQILGLRLRSDTEGGVSLHRAFLISFQFMVREPHHETKALAL